MINLFVKNNWYSKKKYVLSHFILVLMLNFLFVKNHVGKRKNKI
ncbi:hypothetical protein TRIP_D420192 [uncultured Paludibacter sp.]|uniref:Uncharacterized protein n=1 Tax=uncultured Paludibacter sp. TaxID=497635 RepID=A0A653AH46_9BACT|nr:hypothetical protein TRIP_D420192 [uncultured Paludibacter sp.]